MGRTSGTRWTRAVLLEGADVPQEVAAVDENGILRFVGAEPAALVSIEDDDPDSQARPEHFDAVWKPVGSPLPVALRHEDVGWLIDHPDEALSKGVRVRIFDIGLEGDRIVECRPLTPPKRSPEATGAAERLVNQLAESIEALAPSLAAKQGQTVSPQVAFALAQEEQDLRAIEDDFGWLDSGGVAELMGRKRSRSLASNLRAKGQLLGYVRRGQQQVRYPKFQFDDRGVLPVVPELIAVADERGVAHEDLVFWLCSPTGMLEDDARPVDLLRTDPKAVLAAAQYDLGGRSW